MSLIVQKYGGATLATPELMMAVAERIKQQARQSPLIVVVSAMGATTNSLLELAHKMSSHPPRRELDMLLSTGERVSMSLMSMALDRLGVPAISFTGSQAGVLTDDDHFNARIIDVKAPRVEQALKEGKVVILAGFQGVSPVTKEITTLGRGGSDATAIAMAAAFKAQRCEILKDVPAIFTADPRLVSHAKPLQRLQHRQLFEMTFWGAKVVYSRSAEMAMLKNVPLYVGPASDDHATGTLIEASIQNFEETSVVSINSLSHVLELQTSAEISTLQKLFFEAQIAFPQVLMRAPQTVFLASSSDREAQIQDFIKSHRLQGRLISALALTYNKNIVDEQALLTQKIDDVIKQLQIKKLYQTFDQMSAILFVEQDQRLRALQGLHKAFIEKP